MARIWYDTEFFEQGALYAISLISIGMVREDGAEYYAINCDAPWRSIAHDDWLRTNVLATLPGRLVDIERDDVGVPGSVWRFLPDGTDEAYKHPEVIAREVSEFCRVGLRGEEKAELWAYYADYDHVVLSQLFGRMVDLPAHMPMFTYDLQQARDMMYPHYEFEAPDEAAKHNALADARWVAAEAGRMGLVR